MDKKNIYALIIEFTFVPQVVYSVILYLNIRNASPFLIGNLSLFITASFTAVIILAFLCAVKRFFVLRFLLMAVYLVPILSVMYYSFERMYTRLAVFAAVGISITVINIYAFYKYRNYTEERDEVSE